MAAAVVGPWAAPSPESYRRQLLEERQASSCSVRALTFGPWRQEQEGALLACSSSGWSALYSTKQLLQGTGAPQPTPAGQVQLNGGQTTTALDWLPHESTDAAAPGLLLAAGDDGAVHAHDWRSLPEGNAATVAPRQSYRPRGCGSGLRTLTVSGGAVCAGGSRGEGVFVMDGATGQLRAQVATGASGSDVGALKGLHSAQQPQLLVGDSSGTVKLWDLRASTTSAALVLAVAEDSSSGTGGAVVAVAVDAREAWVAAAHRGGQVQLWSLRNPSAGSRRCDALTTTRLAQAAPRAITFDKHSQVRCAGGRVSWRWACCCCPHA